MLPGPIKTWKLPPEDSFSSKTFHGRDVFAVSAAKISVNPGWTSFLEELENPLLLEVPETSLRGDLLFAHVLHVDNFGNCILSATSDDLKEFLPVSLATGSDSAEIPLVAVESYYQSPETDSLLILPGSQGFYELALNGRSAAEHLGLQPGCCITLTGKRGSF